MCLCRNWPGNRKWAQFKTQIIWFGLVECKVLKPILYPLAQADSHWKKFIRRETIPANSKLKPFSTDLLSQQLSMSPADWADYWLTMTRIRNKRLAHLDHGFSMKDYPNITKALHSACFYRTWLKSLIDEKKKFGENIAFGGPTNVEIMELFRSQIEAVCK